MAKPVQLFEFELTRVIQQSPGCKEEVWISEFKGNAGVCESGKPVCVFKFHSDLYCLFYITPTDNRYG